MTQVQIKHRLFTWFEETDSPVQPGVSVLTERIAHMGEIIDIPSDNPHLQRGKDLDAFYTDKEMKEIGEGKYRGADADILYNRLQGVRPAPVVEPADGEGVNVDGLEVEELGEYIKANKLNGPDTVALAGQEPTLESIEKVLDAENIATDNSPRKNVVEPLEAKMAEITGNGS